MNTKKHLSIGWILICLIPSLACSTFTKLSATATVPPTETSVPFITPTSTLKPTSTPLPTATTILPTATAAPVGVPVSNSDYTVEVIKVRKLGSVYLNSNYVWEANPGYLFLELGVKVTEKRDGIVSLPWQNIYVIEESGDAYFPGWGGYQEIESGSNINPTEIIFEQINDGYKEILFSDEVLLRVIWTVKDNNPSIVLFGFDTAPLIEVVID